MSDTYRDARDALREFESRLKLARDALDVAIDRAIPIDFFLAYDAHGVEDDPGFPDILQVVKDADAHRGSLGTAQEIIGGGFDEFDWEIDRALRDLKQALTQFSEPHELIKCAPCEPITASEARALTPPQGRADIAPSNERIERDGYLVIDAHWVVPALLRSAPIEGRVLEPAASPFPDDGSPTPKRASSQRGGALWADSQHQALTQEDNAHGNPHPPARSTVPAHGRLGV